MRIVVALVATVLVGVVAAPAFEGRLVHCRQRLVGELRGRGGPRMPVDLNVAIVSYEGLNVRGRMRCTKERNRAEHCFLRRVVVDGVFDYDDIGFNSLGRQGTLTLSGEGVRCVLQARTPYVRKLCLGAVGGTFECTDSLRGSVSGAFGFSVDRCGPCLVGY